MQTKTRTRSRLALWMLAGAIGGGLPLSMPTPASAQDVKDVAESKVPAPVAAAARANVLDSRDVVYRRAEGDRSPYVVNFTTPQNVRMQVRIAEDGRVVDGPELAPNQPDNAPRREDRQRLATEWAARVRAEQTRTELPRSIPPAPLPSGAPPVAPLPSQVPGIPGPDGTVAPPARAISTEVRAGELPADIVRSLDRFTTGGREVVYYRQRVEDRERYQAVFTDRDGTRKEVTVDRTGSLLAGPLTLTENATDQMLAADKPDQFQLATGARVDARDIPAAPAGAISQYVQRANDVRYRKDTYTTGNIAYSAHWVEPESGRRYFMTAGENGGVIVPPRLSAYQPVAVAGGRRDLPESRDLPPRRGEAGRDLDDRERSARGPDNLVRWNDLPDRVQRAFEPTARRDRDAQYFRQTQDGKVSYGSQYKDADGREMWVRVSEAGNVVAGPVSARTGRGVDERAPARDAARDPAPAAGRVSPDMLRDRVNFDTLPKNVQQRVLRETEGGRDFTNMRHERGGKTYYHTVYTDNRGQQRELWLDDRGEPVAAPRRGD